MKTLFYLLSLTIILSTAACKSIEKLVDQGRYDEAIILATKKLAGKKNKKTKHIMALEEAFAKINLLDINHIDALKTRGDAAAWESIYHYALGIQSRQDRIAPFLPLISKEGYVGHFTLMEVTPTLSEARATLASLYYDNGQELLTYARTSGDKIAAQDAHEAFSKISHYVSSYKDTKSLMYESADLGTFQVLLKLDESMSEADRSIGISHRALSRINNKRWVSYHVDPNTGTAFDMISTLYMDNIDISPEREVVNHFTEKKELERWVDEIDEDGQTRRDTSGQVIKYKEIEVVRADITEVIRTKDAKIAGSVETRDYITGTLVAREDFSHEIHFASDACDLVGDRRALSEAISKRLDHHLLPFPYDSDMVTEGVSKMMDNFVWHLEKLDVRDHYTRQHLAHEGG